MSRSVAAFRCNSYGCNNMAKRGEGRCTPCYHRLVANARARDSYSYSYTSTRSTSSDYTGIFMMVLLVAAAALLYWLGMGVFHAVNGFWHSLPTVDEASMALEFTGGLMGVY